ATGAGADKANLCKHVRGPASRRGSAARFDHRPVLAKRLLFHDAAIAEPEEIATVRLDDGTVFLGGGECPFGHTAIARHEMTGIAPLHIRKLRPDIAERRMHGIETF